MRTQATRSSWNKKSRSGVSYHYQPKQSQHDQARSHPTKRNGRRNSPSNTQNNRRRRPNRNHTQSPFETRRHHDTFRPKFHERRTTGLIDIFGDYENDGVEREESYGKHVYSIDHLMSLRRIPEYQNYSRILPKQIRRRKSLKHYQEGSQSFGAYVRKLHRHHPEEEEKTQSWKPPVLKRRTNVRTDRPTKPPLRHKHARISFDEIEEKVEKIFVEKEAIREEEMNVIELEMPEETKVVEVEEEIPSPEPMKIETPVVEEVKETEEKKTPKKVTTKKKKKRKKQKVVETMNSNDESSGSSSFLKWVLVICIFVAVVSMIVIGMMPSESYDVSSRGDADWVSAVSSRKTTISDSFGSVGIPSVKLPNNGLADYDFVVPLDRPSFPDWTSGFVPS